MSAAPQKVLLAWFSGPNTAPLGKLLLDVAINELHGVSSEVTDHQVETGTNAADNIRVLPQTLQLEGMITNTPLDVPASYSDGVLGSVEVIRRGSISFKAFQFNTPFDRVAEVFGDLIAAIQEANLFSVITTMTTYVNMACTSFTVPRNVDNGNVLRFTMQLQALRFVETQAGQALPPKDQQQNRGAKTGTPLDPKKDQPEISVAAKLIDSSKTATRLFNAVAPQ